MTRTSMNYLKLILLGAVACAMASCASDDPPPSYNAPTTGYYPAPSK